MARETLLYDHRFWDRVLGPEYKKLDLNHRLHLIFSLVLYLNVVLLQLLEFIFDSSITAVRRKSGRFMGYFASGKDPLRRFPPAVIFRKWHENFPDATPYLHDMIQDCAAEIILEESDEIINDRQLKIKSSTLTHTSIQEMLSPGALIHIFKEHAPFTWKLLWTFAASPNRYRKRMAAALDPDENEIEGEDADVDLEDDPNIDDTVEVNRDLLPKSMKGFSRNPVFAVLVSMSMLAFVRNRATNSLPLLCGLFFKIEGTSARSMRMLSNVGMCVSSRTVERVKESVSRDAIEHAKALAHSGNLFVVVFDNINLYLRKFQQRITNRNSMIHATNCAVIGVDAKDIEIKSAVSLNEKLNLRGGRAKATMEDVMPTLEDDKKLREGEEAIIVEMILQYTPGAEKWKNRAEMLKRARKDIPLERPIPTTKTDTRPLGVFDVNEGSKKGVIDLLTLISERVGMTAAEWSSKVRVFIGDWLSSSNFRAARRERKNDITSMKRLEYGEELSQLFHFALQATVMLMKTHLGDSIDDPILLAAHKGLLQRIWDVKNANYAAAKSLIRHSLIARLLHIVMVLKGLQQWSDLKNWEPNDYDELKNLASKIYDSFCTTAAAQKALAANDAWSAQDIFFIRDALLFCYFEQSVAWADPERVLRVMRYWCLSFRGAGQHNYARECAEILLKFKYEVAPALRGLLERSWFVNRFGRDGHWIAADLYLEHLNLLVKRIFIAQGNGVTIDYIMHKGSACVEVFRNASHLVAEFFGNPDRNRRSKEIAFQEDMRVLVEDMDALHLHRGFREHSVSKPVEDIMVLGAQNWSDKFEEFKASTTYDPALEHPVFPLSDSESDSGSTRSSNSEEADEESSGEADEESSGDQTCC
ncbi:hypothetical protein DFP72DRAFT_1078616 [Ephemerocybe angulata]|uniref:DUF6589 domain-containing protein n=1 Tax=Ephemerocybe angulata TaxID=980116 RepID=A0A8H6HDT8_9AGAR|nr:hypothetical protein DFP72DRAFT_1078616 [Tulosesus angulatus]